MSDTHNASSTVLKSVLKPRQSVRKKQAWLTTFTDMIALMLTFFVMTYAMSEPKGEKFEEMFQPAAQQGANKFQGAPLARGDLDTITLTKLTQEKRLDLDYLQSLIDEKLSRAPELRKDLLLTHDAPNNQLVISVPVPLGFQSGSADVSEKGQRVLKDIVEIVSRIKNPIEIRGHSDTSPIRNINAGFASNWDLSLERALSVATVMTRQGYTRPMKVTGQAHSQQELLPETLTRQQRKDLSRRVDIVIHENRYEDRP